jgi:AAA domain
MPDELFRVAHVPGLITRYRFRGHGSGRGEGDRVTEENVLNDLLLGEAAMRVAAVTGEVGTGKSHLVRWLHIELRRRQQHSPDLQRLHIVYVPKTKTTLRRVVERILDQQQSPRFDEFRERLQRAQDAFNRETAPHRLLDELANSIRDLAQDELAQGNAHRTLLIKELPTLLQDPVYREALLEETGVIRSTIDNALERVSSAEDGRPRFDDTDLHLDLSDFTDMSQKAVRTFGRLAQPKFREPALALMNEQLDRAVGALLDVRRGEVGELLLDVRAELHDQGLELVLLIEDFALLQGVERELLEAVIAPIQEVEGRTLCPVRAVFAVTTGHFEDMDTVLSRVDADGGYRYSLDADFDSDSGPVATLDDALTLVGSYLNAARLGKAAIENWSRDHADDSSLAPNACNNCELIDDCHRGFGESRLGHGLYPFNRTAVARILQGQGATTFEPREMLKHVRDTLRDERPAIAKGTFPTQAWTRKHNPSLTPMAKTVLDGLREAHKTEAKAEQAEHLLMFWGGETSRLVNLDPDIHNAFSVPQVPDAPTLDDAVTEVSPPKPAPRDERKAGAVAPVAIEPIDAEAATIAGWRTAVRAGTVREHELPAPLARELRNQFAELALERSSVGLSFLSYDQRDTSNALAAGIHIDGAAGGNPRSDAAVVVRLGADDEPLLLALRKLRWAAQDLTAADLAAIAEGIDGHRDEVVAWLSDQRAPKDRLVEAIEFLYVAAATTNAGLGARVDIRDDDLMRALFAPPSAGLATASLPERHALEIGLLESSTLEEAMETVGHALSVRQNVVRGGPSGIDASAVLACIDELRSRDLNGQSSRSRTGPGAALTRARAVLDAVIEEGREVLETTVARMKRLLSPDSDAKAIADEYRLTIDALMNANAFAADATHARNAADAFGAVDLSRLTELALAALETHQDRDTTLRSLARVPWRELEAVEMFLTSAEEALLASEARLSDSTSEGFDTLGQLAKAREAASNVAAALERFSQFEDADE